MFDLAEYIGDMTRKGATNGGEYAGPCPACGGQDRFRVWPDHPKSDTGRYWCRQCETNGDGIDYLRTFEAYTFPEACEITGMDHKLDNNARSNSMSRRSTPDTPRPQPARDRPQTVQPPPADWQACGRELVRAAEAHLWHDTPAGRSARRYLKQRGFTETSLQSIHAGVIPKDYRLPASQWGITDRKEVWTPRGIVLPRFLWGHLWCIRIRRPDGDVGGRDSRYISPPGVINSLFLTRPMCSGEMVVLCEGELDALAVTQETGITAAATGSTAWGRGERWETLLSFASRVVVAFDADEAGQTAAAYWMDALPNAVALAPIKDDPAGMLERGDSLTEWLKPVREPPESPCTLSAAA